MKIAVCQLDPLVGDTRGNAARICEIVKEKSALNVDLIIFSELFIQGYPPRDLLERQWFIHNTTQAIDQICSCSKRYPGIGILTGAALPASTTKGKGLANAAIFICDGEIKFRQDKSLLPTYDVFDESRYFDPAESVAIFRFKDETLGITICEDAWSDSQIWLRQLYTRDPVADLASMGASFLINISASPFHAGKESARSIIMKNHCVRNRLPLLVVNQVGANDDLIFDGNSMYFDKDGNLRAHLASFKEEIKIIDTKDPGEIISFPEFDRIASVHDALKLGLSDYVKKCGFKKVVLGLSGGIDSAVTCVIAARALGSQNVVGITMPSRHSSEGSVNDSKVLAVNLGIEFHEIPIEKAYSCFLDTLDPLFKGTTHGVAEENLQARVRGTLLMALSNKFGYLLISTGNKSEMAVGYSTLYGDMNGGLSVISDLPKDMVYKLAYYINKDKEIIPSATLTKAPSAELRPNQTDQDTLPPYPVLDGILERLIEQGKSSAEIISEGFDKETVDWVVSAVKLNEYKRRQAPTGLKVTPKAFGTGRRFPIASRYEW